jgi:hypothetical protein
MSGLRLGMAEADVVHPVPARPRDAATRALICLAARLELRSTPDMSYHRPKQLCLWCRPYEDPTTERESPSVEEIERALSLFAARDRHTSVPANIREAIAEDRRALGLAPMRTRR